MSLSSSSSHKMGPLAAPVPVPTSQFVIFELKPGWRCNVHPATSCISLHFHDFVLRVSFSLLLCKSSSLHLYFLKHQLKTRRLKTCHFSMLVMAPLHPVPHGSPSVSDYLPEVRDGTPAPVPLLPDSFLTALPCLSFQQNKCCFSCAS